MRSSYGSKHPYKGSRVRLVNKCVIDIFFYSQAVSGDVAHSIQNEFKLPPADRRRQFTNVKLGRVSGENRL